LPGVISRIAIIRFAHKTPIVSALGAPSNGLNPITLSRQSQFDGRYRPAKHQKSLVCSVGNVVPEEAGWDPSIRDMPEDGTWGPCRSPIRGYAPLPYVSFRNDTLAQMAGQTELPHHSQTCEGGLEFERAAILAPHPPPPPGTRAEAASLQHGRREGAPP
jgi:hypothetical protein